MTKLAYLIMIPLIVTCMVVGFFCINIVLYALIGTGVSESSIENLSSGKAGIELSLQDGS